MNNMSPNELSHYLHDIREFLDHHSDEEIRNAIASEDFSNLIHVPENVRRRISSHPNLWNDIWWYVEIRADLRVEDFPCVHIAYATSPKAGCVICRFHDVYLVNFAGKQNEGIVIGYCPWCAEPLNVNAISKATG
ncbi:hypothetical protein [Rhizobium halophytocola]|uniref:Uncharacterized protein n=1 Tax=Rhizobium halophytocola TaxID=735519 RepID=A0ABS4E5F2_9HYPH|nr:hypothetical protein [Rhizobium halophytocola]MBP1853179.1 hypothetical protein [Rhizobium halophytocola]